MSYVVVDAEHVETGKVVELLCSNSVQMGAKFKDDDGQEYIRVPSVPNARVKRYSFTGYTLPRRGAAIEGGFALAKQYDHKGRAVFDSKAEVNEYMARHNDNPNNGTQISFDPDGND